MKASFIEHFLELEDPRIERKERHQLMDILVLVACAMVSGAEGWETTQGVHRAPYMDSSIIAR